MYLWGQGWTSQDPIWRTGLKLKGSKRLIKTRLLKKKPAWAFMQPACPLLKRNSQSSHCMTATQLWSLCTVKPAVSDFIYHFDDLCWSLCSLTSRTLQTATGTYIKQVEWKYSMSVSETMGTTLEQSRQHSHGTQVYFSSIFFQRVAFNDNITTKKVIEESPPQG